MSVSGVPALQITPPLLKQNRAPERKVQDLGDMEWLSAHACYTENEFWQIYDRRRQEPDKMPHTYRICGKR